MDKSQNNNNIGEAKEIVKSHYCIGIVCLHNNNYGNNLTNYALYRYLTNLGYSVLMIDQTRDANWIPYDEKLSYFMQIPYTNEDLLPSCELKITLKEINHYCNMFIVGSDQLFRSMFIEGLNYHSCLDWVASNKYKMSYGTSFGTETFEGNEQLASKMAYYLQRFQAISVREKSGLQILHDTFGVEGEWVVDPVFLCEKKYYLDMVKKGSEKVPKVPYVGAYVLDVSKLKETVINSICIQEGDIEYSIISDAEIDEQETKARSKLAIWSKPKIEEWLANIFNSEVFVTDSFHGLCFALIFNKNFWVVSEPKNWRGRERIEAILHSLHLESRLIESFDNLKDIDFHIAIDYSEINSIIAEQIGKSGKWLADQCKKGIAYKGNLDTYDILGDRIDQVALTERKMCDDMKAISININNVSRKNEQNFKEYQQENNDTNNRIDQLIISSNETYESVMSLENEQKRIGKLLDELNQKNYDISIQLSQLMDENHELSNQLINIYSSHSWKVTWPLRMIKKAIDKVINHK